MESYTEEIVDDMAAFYGEDESYVVYPHGEPDPASW
jgi:hypothetical protein